MKKENIDTEVLGVDETMLADQNLPDGIEEQEEILAKQQSNSANNKRIAKNTMLLYFRMMLTMGVSLYTSRVVLDVLGVEDYGVYNVVGGVVAMFSFLNASMGSATSRFLTFSIGKDPISKTKEIFTTTLLIHLILASVILLISETIGLWFLENKLVIPEQSLQASRIVFQLSIMVAVIGILRVPFDAIIIAHERFDFYAKIEILNVILKLLIVYLISVLPYNKLIIYSVLVLGVAFIIALSYLFYARKNFPEASMSKQIDKQKMKSMLSFSTWDLYGNMSVMFRTQGVSMLLNIFFGTVANAAAGIAGQVQGAVMSFSSNILTAFKPQVIKQYSQGNHDQMCVLIYNACKYSTILLLMITIPVIFNIKYLLALWLKEVPEYTISFCIWTLIFNLGATLSSGVISGIHATGNIKRPSLINGSLYLMVIPVSYILFNLGYPSYYSFIFNAIAVFAGCFSNIYTLHLFVPQFKMLVFFRQVIIPLFILTLSGVGSIFFVKKIFLIDGFLLLVISILVAVFSITSLTYLFVLDKQIKDKLNQKIKSLIR